MKLKILITVLITVAILSNKATAQDNFGIKYFGLSIHPKGENENAFLMPNKLDKNGFLVLNLGAELMYEKFILKDILSIKIIQALYADCAERPGGFSHIGVRGKILKKGKHSIYGGIGPTLVYRKSWLELPGYVNPNRFNSTTGNNIQYLFIWYGGEFEYKYQLGSQIDLAVSFVPGYPDLMSLALGLNFRMKGFKKKLRKHFNMEFEKQIVTISHSKM
jgi:hypothetical protein